LRKGGNGGGRGYFFPKKVEDKPGGGWKKIGFFREGMVRKTGEKKMPKKGPIRKDVVPFFLIRKGRQGAWAEAFEEYPKEGEQVNKNLLQKKRRRGGGKKRRRFLRGGEVRVPGIWG